MELGILVLGIFPAVVPWCLCGISQCEQDGHDGRCLEEGFQAGHQAYDPGLLRLCPLGQLENTAIKVIAQRCLLFLGE